MTTRVSAIITLTCLIHLSVAGSLQASQGRAVARISPESLTDGATDRGQTGVVAAIAELPLVFEQNVGQSDDRVAFLTSGPGYRLFLAHDEIVFALRHAKAPAADRLSGEVERHERRERTEASEPDATSTTLLRMRLAGARATTPVGEEPIETRTNYFLGDDPSRWLTNVANFGHVRYPSVYPGVDLVFRGTGGELEYDFVVAAGADPSAIQLEWEGTEAIEIGPSGELVMKVPGGEVRQAAPVLFQETESGKAYVAGRFEPAGDGRVVFDVGAYDTGRPLVIDPILTYSTFLGGNDTDSAIDIAIDAFGGAYVLGSTSSTDFPTVGAYDSSPNGYRSVFVTKLSPAGNALVYSTFLGGTVADFANGIAVDSAGAAYIAGSTRSPDFPTVNAYDSSFNGSNNDAFVTKLSPAGNALVYSTFLGGTSNEVAESVTVDGAAAYVVGETSSIDFPSPAGAFDRSLTGSTDAFVACLTFSAGSLLLTYATFLGGSSSEEGVAIAVSQGQAVVTGVTFSTDFPTASAFDSSFGGDLNDSFMAKLSPGGDALVYSTYLGGNSLDRAADVAVDSAGAAYVTGYTYSDDYPLENGYDSTIDSRDAFVTKLSATGTMVYSTALGGLGSDIGYGIAVDSTGAVYVAGQTLSTDFPTAYAYDPSYSGGFCDGFVSRLSPEGDALAYSTYLGGSDIDAVHGIAVDASGSAYVVGSVWSADFPTASAFDPSFGGGTTVNPSDAFVAKLTAAADLRGTMSATPNPVWWNEHLTYRITVTNLGPAPATDVRATMATPAQTTFVSVATSQGSFDITPLVGGTGSVVVTLGELAPSASAIVTVVVKVRIRSTGSISGRAYLTSLSFDPSPTNNSPGRSTPIG